MRYIMLICIEVLASSAFSMDDRVARVASISVSLTNLPDDIPFHLLRLREERGNDTLETVYSHDGYVRFMYPLAANGEMVFVAVEKSKIGFKGKRSWIRVFVDKSDIRIKGDFRQWPAISIKDSKATEIYERYHVLKSPMVDKIEDILKKMTEKSISDSSFLKRALAEYREFSLMFFRKNINVLSIPLMIEKSYPLNIVDRKQLLSEMNQTSRESFYGKQLERAIGKMEFVESADVRIHALIPDLQMKSENGIDLSIREIAKKNTYTLIDFWAYWCGPCREEIPKLKKVYEKYHDKGLEVVGVSTDPNYGAWVKTLNELGTKWINVIDQSGVSKDIFSIIAIPGYVLLNDKAEIIAMDVVGNKNNGTSARYFGRNVRMIPNGSSISQVIEQLMNNER